MQKPFEIIKKVVENKPKMYSIITKKIFCPKEDKTADHICDKKFRNGHPATAKGVTWVQISKNIYLMIK